MDIHKCTIFKARWRSLSPIQGSHGFPKKNKTSVLEWSGNSPDLNTIENASTTMKDKLADKQPPSAQDLKQVTKDVWVTEITQEYCESVVSSMPRHIQAVMDSK